MVEVVEVVRRSEQGITKPFICRGDDGDFYFVKGMGGAGRRSLICEWICGQLGLALGLPIAPFEIVHVPPQLVAIESSLQLDELGAGPAFGSRHQHVTELTVEAVHEVPASLRRDVLLFDWWIKNDDRTLSAYGGNPNLFWQPENRNLVVIDHNVALQASLNFHDFLEYHAFRDDVVDTFGDFERRREYTERLSAALDHWERIVECIPPEWLYLDADYLDPINLDLAAVRTLLARYATDDFWKWHE